MRSLEQIKIEEWDESYPHDKARKALKSLEEGKVLYFPALSFDLTQSEMKFLNPEKTDPKRKNISYELKSGHLGGALCTPTEAEELKAMMKRFALAGKNLINHLLPHYKKSIIHARTSFRPVEIHGRKNSVRKDDTLLHVDAFPSAPTKGSRILRLFTNINHEGKNRVWRTGEPFKEVVNQFAKKVSPPFPGLPHLLKLLKITKDLRTPYDHYMLNIHNLMKEDAGYQRNVPFEEILFPPGSSWMVFTDQVSHAALSGQHVLEQTFYLPINGMKEESTSPLRELEHYFKRELV